MDQTTWEENEFQKKVRITEEDLEWLKKTRGKQTIARRLKEIINKERYGNARFRAKGGVQATKGHK